ncbi:hypothetical protein [Neptunomonas japonica]|uniref:hypothetical protein n=1 Tax=Neptunomonas japonica TaxID=417574 RepID=UPI000403F6E3|nr:hypothetical protein [Neptunomonas japonica]
MIPDRYLADCHQPLAMGFSKQLLLEWGLDQHEASDLCNARLLCAREINSGRIKDCKVKE